LTDIDGYSPPDKNDRPDVESELWWCDTINGWECEGQLMNGVPCPEHGD